MNKIKLSELKKIIAEEISLLSEKTNREQREQIDKISNQASKLLNAIEDFKESVDPIASGEIMPHLDKVEEILDDMHRNARGYVEKMQSRVKKVSLKPAKEQPL